MDNEEFFWFAVIAILSFFTATWYFLRHIVWWSTKLYHIWVTSAACRKLSSYLNYGLVYSTSFLLSQRNVTHSSFPPLDQSRDSLRLARISPGSGTLVLDVQQYNFLNVPQFDALSYVWGDLSHPHVHYVLVNGVPTGVNVNLYDALRHNRHPKDNVWLWIDALCIDQTNATEKNSQIPLMAFIYSRAWRVRVWLGNLEYVNEREVRETKTWIASSPSPDSDAPVWNRNVWWIHTLLTSQYWKRVWVVQEMVAAREVQLQLGKHLFDWDEFLAMAYFYGNTTNGWIFDHLPTKKTIEAVNELRADRYGDLDAFRLDRLLDRFKDGMCDDPRDKIYGLLGIANDVFQDDIEVDYTKSIHEVYADVMKFINRTHGAEASVQVSLMDTASLVRRLLSRKPEPKQVSDLTPSKYDLVAKKWSDSVAECGSRQDFYCTALRLLSMLKMYVLRYQFAVEDARPKVDTKCWKWSDLEYKGDWDVESGTQDASTGFTVRGKVIGYIAPSNVRDIDIAARADAGKKWLRFLREVFPADWSFKETLFSQNQRLMTLLGTFNRSWRFMDIRNLRLDPEFDATENVLMRADTSRLDPDYSDADAWWASGQLAVGSTGFVAVVPVAARHGDLICQFYGSRGAAVIRDLGRDRYSIVGRASVLHKSTDLDWDRPLNMSDFEVSSNTTLELRMNLRMLTALSLNSFFLPGTAL